jgi:exonuclease SbcD
MKRIAVIGDSHFDEHSRFAECCRLHEWIERDIAARAVDLVVHTGDVFERKSTPTERNKVAEWLCDVAQTAPVVIVRGNHDVVGDLAIFAELRSRHPITVVETCGMHVIAGIAVACVAWPRKAHLLATIQGGLEESEQAAGDALRNVIRGLGDKLSTHDGPRLLAMHAMVRGSVTSVGQPLVGCDLEIGLDDLGLAQAHFVALGHIHKGQDWNANGRPVVYPGSPRRTAFGEAEDKGYVVVSISEDGAATWERVIVPATAMLLLEDEWTDGAWQVGWHGLGAAPQPAGAEVRLRYTVAAEDRDAARRAVAGVRDDLLAKGAISVKVEEEVRATVRARAPEVAAATTLAGKLEALWRSRNDVPPTERAARLISKVSDLEVEVAA